MLDKQVAKIEGLGRSGRERGIGVRRRGRLAYVKKTCRSGRRGKKMRHPEDGNPSPSPNKRKTSPFVRGTPLSEENLGKEGGKK